MRYYNQVLCILLVAVTTIGLQAQNNVGIGTTTPAAGAMLDISSADKGILIPRVETSAVTSPVLGLLVFQPSDSVFYYYNGTTWQGLGGGGVIDTDGDTRIEAIDQAGNDKIVGTIDGVEKLTLLRNANGDLMIQPENFLTGNTFVGRFSGQSAGGSFNTGVGSFALQYATGYSNTAMGANALNINNSGIANTAFGAAALIFNTSGHYNVAVGVNALGSNSTGSSNIAIGRNALGSNTVRSHVIAIGDSALFYNGTGSGAPDAGLDNLAIGSKALLKTTFGRNNTAVGQEALRHSTGLSTLNTAIGWHALLSQQSGSSNTAIGASSLGSSTGGLANTAIGTAALVLNQTGDNNVALGWRSGGGNLTGSNNIFIGKDAGYHESGSHKLYIESSNADADSALIYGEFDNSLLRINGHMQVNTYDFGHPGVSSIIDVPNTGDVAGVYGENAMRDFYGFGVHGKGGYIGVLGQTSGTGQGSEYYYGVYGVSNGSTAGTNYGVYGQASGGGTNYAGYFAGNAFVADTLGIGTTNFADGYRLSVDGRIACEEVLVDLSQDWPDYVFEPGYTLMSLSDLRSFIDDKGHLPGIPSAVEVESNGLVVGEMQARLMEKVEELTLYILRQEERIASLESRIHTLKSQGQ